MNDPFDRAVSAARAALVAGRAPTVAEMDPRGEMDVCVLVLAASRARDELAKGAPCVFW